MKENDEVVYRASSIVTYLQSQLTKTIGGTAVTTVMDRNH